MEITNGTEDREDSASEVAVLSVDSVESDTKLLRECSIQFPSSDNANVLGFPCER